MYDKNVLFEKDYICPCCNTAFKTLAVKTRSTKYTSIGTDLCPVYEGINPNYYALVLCEHCGYCAFTNDFEKISLEAKKAVRADISSKWKPRSFTGEHTLDTAIEIYSIGYLNYLVQKKPPSECARCALRLSWLYREKGDSRQESRFEKIALNLYKKAYLEENLDNDVNNRTTVYYLIGELSFRQGDLKEAVKFYRESLVSNSKGGNAQLKQLAEDQMEHVKTLYKSRRYDDDDELE